MLTIFQASLSRLAHEVYVLTPQEVTHDEHIRKTDPWSVLTHSHDLWLAIAFAVGIGLVLIIAALLKRTKPFQKIGATINKATVIAPDIIRVAFGASLIFSSLHNSLFGPELPLHSFAGAAILRPLLLIVGVALVIGLRSRIFAAVALLIWCFAFMSKGWYILTYTNYLGEALAVILFPVQTITLDKLIYKLRGIKIPRPSFERYSLTVTRIGFAFALFYTAITIKFLQANLPLDVVHRYALTRYFPFDPLFIVLGAGLIEILVAVMYFTGLLQRLTTIIFVIFITLSIAFFKETVWPHYLLLALGIGIFLHEPDNYALDKHWFNGAKRAKRRS